MEERDDWTLTEALHHEDGRGDPFAAAVRSTRMAMVITDPRQEDNPIIFANEAFQTLTGYGRQEIIGRNCRFLQGPQTDREIVEQIRKAIETETDVSVDILNYRKDGTSFWNALYISPVKDDAGKVQFFFASSLDVTDRIDGHLRVIREKARIEAEVARRVAELRTALDAQTLLLHEVDHRVKNNMSMIGSILRLQLRETHDEATQGLLRAMMSRVDAMATVHRHLYQSEDVTRFDIGAYCVNLASDLGQMKQGTDIRIRADLGRADVPAGQASALGLIVNEILNHMLTADCGRQHMILDISASTEGKQVHLAIRLTADDTQDARMPPLVPSYSPSGVNEQIILRLSAQTKTAVFWSDQNSGSSEVRITINLEAL
ncbi:histidine kinase dimerization/phosphoacceptor domain -containing protein [Paracoccus hibiscisoli]|uniref:PAS domain-containing protein n=1 Tax=Paracoccus hibiscisoli TaxID=2023261 RepID=A0A4U0QCA4_9RHOB|nr:histidine kinase dimerization/phosphoacceptor domain -containing protein [Paracoccus hibiscisoli]TJZ78162.1 PAS domain-containing protein [Paracoccus hibiscisoli]